jgi:hypothetical protein
MLAVMEQLGGAALWTFVGAYATAVQFGTCSAPMVDDVLERIPRLMGTKDPDLQHNVAFLLNCLVIRKPASVPDVMEILPQIWEWFTENVSIANGRQSVTANIASLILTRAVHGAAISEEMLIAAFRQMPPADLKETVPMVTSLTAILGSGSEFSLQVVVAAMFAVSELLLLSTAQQAAREMTSEVGESLITVFKQLIASNESLLGTLQDRYQKSRSKMRKLEAALQ